MSDSAHALGYFYKDKKVGAWEYDVITDVNSLFNALKKKMWFML